MVGHAFLKEFVNYISVNSDITYFYNYVGQAYYNISLVF